MLLLDITIQFEEQRIVKERSSFLFILFFEKGRILEKQKGRFLRKRDPGCCAGLTSFWRYKTDLDNERDRLAVDLKRLGFASINKRTIRGGDYTAENDGYRLSWWPYREKKEEKHEQNLEEERERGG